MDPGEKSTQFLLHATDWTKSRILNKAITAKTKVSITFLISPYFAVLIILYNRSC